MFIAHDLPMVNHISSRIIDSDKLSGNSIVLVFTSGDLKYDFIGRRIMVSPVSDMECCLTQS
ncbi:MAG: hypothetical protein V8Q42_01380 [Anaerovoracaceae bacterium]